MKGFAACVVAVVLTWGCATAPASDRPAGSTAPRSPTERADRAMTALQREAYRPAREDLLALVSDCRSGAYGRRALLLLATAELDTGNPDGSPGEAARLASIYLRLPDADAEDLPLARALYRIGNDLATLPHQGTRAAPAPVVAPRFDTCDPGASGLVDRPLPTTPSPRAARLASLEERLASREEELTTREQELAALEERLAAQADSLTAQADSLDALESALRIRATRIAQLDAEIDRIMELLKTGLPGYRADGGR
jgi:hypothetical protein